MSGAAAENGAVAVRRAPRWVWALLILSLAVNLLILGVALGSVWAMRSGGYWDAPVAFERSQRFMGRLPEARRREIRAIFFEYRARLAPYWREVRAARVAIGRLIEKGGYSGQEFDAALDALFQKELAARQAIKPMVAEMVAKLEPDERTHFLSVFFPYLDDFQTRAGGNPPSP
jgi:uncharacterized membrane protein